jgi:hypothetical protein
MRNSQQLSNFTSIIPAFFKSALRQSSKIVQNRSPGTLNFFFSCFLIMIFFTVNPIIFGEVLDAKKHVICWNIRLEDSTFGTLIRDKRDKTLIFRTHFYYMWYIYYFSGQDSCVELFIFKKNSTETKCFIHLVIIIQILYIQNCVLNFYETSKGYLYIEKTAILLREFASWEIKEDLG